MPSIRRTFSSIKKSIAVVCLATLVSCANNPQPKAPLAAQTRLQGWLNHYRLQPASFTDSGAVETRQCMAVEYHLESDTGNLFRQFLIYSPDSLLCIDLDSYSLVVEPDNKGHLKALGYEPDSEVALIDLTNHSRTRVMFCGTSCIFEEVQWIDNDTFYVLGFDGASNALRPAMWEHRNSSNTVREIRSTQSVNPKHINYAHTQRLKGIDFSAFR